MNLMKTFYPRLTFEAKSVPIGIIKPICTSQSIFVHRCRVTKKNYEVSRVSPMKKSYLANGVKKIGG